MIYNSRQNSICVLCNMEKTFEHAIRIIFIIA